MVVKQVYDIVNSVNKQMNGETAVTVTDLTGLIQMGQSILSSQTSKDNFLNTLVDRIGKTIISGRVYSANVLDIISHAFEFGAVLQKIYVEPRPAKKSPHWDLAEGDSVDQYIIQKPTVKQKLFTGSVTWEVQVTIPDMQLKSAFTSGEQMAVFIDAIFMALRNSMELQLEGMIESTYCNFIAERIHHVKNNVNSLLAINLLTEYNTETGGTLTVNDALKNLDFLKYATVKINLYLKRMGRMSVLFNAEGYKRFTKPESARVIMLADFASAVTSYLQADTFNNDLVALPLYSEVPYWQGSGTDYDFTSTSLVDVTTSDGHVVSQTGVICLIADVEALGITMDNRRSKSAYNESGEYTNFWEKADMGYFNDLSENGIVFLVA